ncbi:hypothetical protein [Cellulosilyticum lentocellum]|uniref:Uncharacterized protein n=1 Tax=Cellulosilyticum lentocellum (strain ATCC 49066 / DSM 5427 / NCIMB 11756 / RHM5) TaxID=642492 RepID=F2JQT5_CELLD|nr:hypothetical protein [Cellulosilyticum lentocellum]ADZ82680.1 hypothetical protein Clole_0948 [Cellulosilyticum lentocellum DSM 5427]
MLKERQMFDDAYKWLEENYDNTDFDKLSQELPNICNRYKGSGLWQSLVYAVLDHLEAKAKYERSKQHANTQS